MEVDSPIPTNAVEQFKSLGALSPQDRFKACPGLLDHIITTSSSNSLENNLAAYLVFILDSDRPIADVPKPSEPLSLVSSRPLLSAFVAKLGKLESNDLKLILAPIALNLITPRRVSFEEQDAELKLVLANAQQVDEEYVAAARTLDSINLASTSRAVTDEDKCDIWVRIARCYLEENDTVNASSYINRAKNVIHGVRNPTLRLMYHISSARILDSQRAFLDAAKAYHDISYEPNVDEDDRIRTLGAAINCVVLAPAGPQRSRILAKLYKDERARDVPSFGILENIFLDRMLRAEDVHNFADGLEEHQKAKTSDGSTVIERAMLEHNLLGASRIYRNIGIEQLGGLLGVTGERAEQYAAQMIEQGRLLGHIDQIDQIIFFEGRGSTDGIAPPSVAGGQELRYWDLNVQGLADEVEKVATMIQDQFPDFYTANMAQA